MAVVEEAPPLRKGPSLVIQIGVLLVLTLLAAGTGWFVGHMLVGERPPATAEAEKPAAQAGAHGAAPVAEGKESAPAAGGHGEAAAPAADPLLVPLAPMTANLAAPSTVWIRMELSLLLAAPLPQDVIESIHQDLFAYVKTLKLHQIEGASGYLHLKTDLEERAAIRSDGQVKQVLIRTLLFE